MKTEFWKLHAIIYKNEFSVNFHMKQECPVYDKIKKNCPCVTVKWKKSTRKKGKIVELKQLEPNV